MQEAREFGSGAGKEKNQSVAAVPKEFQTLDLLDQDSKLAEICSRT